MTDVGNFLSVCQILMASSIQLKSVFFKDGWPLQYLASYRCPTQRGEAIRLTLPEGESDRLIDCYLNEPAHERCRPSITSRAMLQLQSLSPSMTLIQNRIERTGEGMGGRRDERCTSVRMSVWVSECVRVLV